MRTAGFLGFITIVMAGCAADVGYDGEHQKSSAAQCDLPSLLFEIALSGNHKDASGTRRLDGDGSDADYRAREVRLDGRPVRVAGTLSVAPVLNGGLYPFTWPEGSTAVLSFDVVDADEGEDVRWGGRLRPLFDSDDDVGSLQFELDMDAVVAGEQTLVKTLVGSDGVEYFRAELRYSRRCKQWDWVRNLQQDHEAQAEPTELSDIGEEMLSCSGAVDVVDLSSDMSEPRMAPLQRYTHAVPLGLAWLQADSRGRYAFGLYCNGDGFAPRWYDVTYASADRQIRPNIIGNGDGTYLVKSQLGRL